MHTHVDRTQEKKSQSTAHVVAQKKNGGQSTVQFVDNRPEAIALKKLQETAHHSPQVKQAAQLKAIADHYSTQQQRLIQKKENNTGLPDQSKSGIESLPSYSMDDVGGHDNADAPAQAKKKEVNHSGVVIQRVGRLGHIGIGTAIGTIVPILGNIIGGFVGNHIFNKKQARLARGQRQATHHQAVNQQHLQALRQHIDTIRNNIQGQNFAQAAQDLGDPTVLRNLGITLRADITGGGDGVVDRIAGHNMFYPQDNRVVITFPMPPNWADPARSKKILFMALEEYMHAYQHLSNTYFSPLTREYKGTDRGQNNAQQNMGYDFDEIDVMSAYQDWGEDAQALDYVNRYQERQHFHQWRQDREGTGYKIKDALAMT